MDNKEQQKDISGFEFDKVKTQNDYKFLSQKLKKINLTDLNFVQNKDYNYF